MPPNAIGIRLPQIIHFMKIFFVIAGFVIFFGILLIEFNSNKFQALPIGLYLFPLACLASATFWKRADKDDSYYYYARKVYALLANEDHSIESILDKVDAGYHPGDQASTHITKTVIKMIEEGNLTIVDGKVRVSPKKFAADSAAT